MRQISGIVDKFDTEKERHLKKSKDEIALLNPLSVSDLFTIQAISHIYIKSKVKLATIVEGDPKAPFSIAYYTKV